MFIEEPLQPERIFSKPRLLEHRSLHDFHLSAIAIFASSFKVISPARLPRSSFCCIQSTKSTFCGLCLMNFASHLHTKLNSLRSRKAFIISEILPHPKSLARILLPRVNRMTGLAEPSTKVATSWEGKRGRGVGRSFYIHERNEIN